MAIAPVLLPLLRKLCGSTFKRGSRIAPRMALSFINDVNVLDNRITFSRGSGGGAFGSDGLYKWYGYNLLLQSEDCSTATWTKSAFVSVSGEVVTDASGSGSTYQTVAVTASTQYTFSFYAMRGTAGTLSYAIYNVSGASFITAATDYTSQVNTSGYTRVTATFTTPVGCVSIRVYPLAGTGTAGTVYIRRSQLEQASTASSYSPTTTAASGAPRFDYDPATPAGVTGGELVTNGDFSNGSTGWYTTTATQVVSAGAVTITATGTSFPRTTTLANVNMVAGKTYKLTYTGSKNTVSLPWAVRFNSETGYPTYTNTSPQTYSRYFTASGPEALLLTISGGSATVGDTATFSNISVQEVVFTPRGFMVEEQRTNLATNSRVLNSWITRTDVTITTALGIDGTSGASNVVEGVAGTATIGQNPAGITAGSTITGSVVAKYSSGNAWIRLKVGDTTGADAVNAYFNIQTGVKGAATATGAATSASNTITALGGGWYRCTATVVPNGVYTAGLIAIQSATADGNATRVNNATYIVDYAQLEVGAFATSPIPTTTASATRSADSASMTGTNFSSWWNPTQGTFISEFDISNTTADSFVFQAVGGGVPAIGHRRNASNQWSNRIRDGVSTLDINPAGTPAINTTYKFASSFSTTVTPSAYACVNGGTVISQAGSMALVTGLNTLRIGSQDSAPSALLNGHIRRLQFYPTSLPSATLVTLTS